MPVDNSSSSPSPSPSDFAIASEPFNDPSLADLILRSNDNTDFYVFRGILMFTSPIFRDMVAVSDSSNALAKDELMKDGLRVVIMHESSAVVIDALLRFLYPTARPVMDLDTIAGVAFAARKYEMDYVLNGARQALKLLKIDDSAKNAVQAYLLASTFEWDDIAHTYAVETLKYTLDMIQPLCNDGSVDIAHVLRLFSFRQRAIMRVSAFMASDDSFDKAIGEFNHCSDSKRSGAWSLWRLTSLMMIFRTPLAFMDDVKEGKSLADRFASASPCSACDKVVATKCSPAIIKLKMEFSRIANQTEIVDNPKTLSPEKDEK